MEHLYRELRCLSFPRETNNELFCFHDLLVNNRRYFEQQENMFNLNVIIINFIYHFPHDYKIASRKLFVALAFMRFYMRMDAGGKLL